MVGELPSSSRCPSRAFVAPRHVSAPPRSATKPKLTTAFRFNASGSYATPIETMLGQLLDEGATVQFGSVLTGVHAAEEEDGGDDAGRVRLTFEGVGAPTVLARRVLLNLPRHVCVAAWRIRIFRRLF